MDNILIFLYVTEMGLREEFEAIKGLYKEANDLLGNTK